MNDQPSISLEFEISERSFPLVCTKMIFKQGKGCVELGLKLHQKDKTPHSFPRGQGVIAFVSLMLRYKQMHTGAAGDFTFPTFERGTIEASAYDAIDKQKKWLDDGLGCDHKQIFTVSPTKGGLSIRIRSSVLPPENIHIFQEGKKRELKIQNIGEMLAYLGNCWITIQKRPNLSPATEKEAIVPTNDLDLNYLFMPPWAIWPSEDKIKAFNTDLMLPTMDRCVKLAAAAHDSELQFRLLVYVAGCLHLEKQHAKAADYAKRAQLVGRNLPNSPLVTDSQPVLDAIAAARQDESNQ